MTSFVEGAGTRRLPPIRYLRTILRRRGRRAGGATFVLRLDPGQLLLRSLRDRPLEPLAGREQPPATDEDQRSEDRDRGVVEREPREVAVPRHAGRRHRENEEHRDEGDPETCDRPDPAVVLPEVPLAGLP